MNRSIEKLLTLAQEFPTRKRIDYEKDVDRRFCNEVLLAVKEAAPEIKRLVFEDDAAESIATSLSAAPETAAPSPSNGTSQATETGSSTRTPTEPVKTADTSEASDRTQGTEGKPLSGLARYNAQRKLAALARRARSVAASAQNPAGQESAPPPEQPQATV